MPRVRELPPVNLPTLITGGKNVSTQTESQRNDRRITSDERFAERSRVAWVRDIPQVDRTFTTRCK
jgi:hypothetical protein